MRPCAAFVAVSIKRLAACSSLENSKKRHGRACLGPK